MHAGRTQQYLDKQRKACWTKERLLKAVELIKKLQDLLQTLSS